jgi:hypothetical protein
MLSAPAFWPEIKMVGCLFFRDDASSIFDGLMEEDEKDKAKR